MKSFSRPTTTTTTTTTPAFSPPPYAPTPRPSRLSSLLSTLFLALSTLALPHALAITACTASSLRSYHHTDLPPSWYLPLWPSPLDLRPTRALLATGVIVAVISLSNVAVGIVPGLRNRTPTRLRGALFAATSALGLFLGIFALALARALNDADARTLQSWSCNFRSFAAVAPLGFVDICRQSRAAVDLMGLLLVLEGLALGCAGLEWWVEGRKGRAGGEMKLEEFS